jgi:NAD(P)H-hydrate epimerase
MDMFDAACLAAYMCGKAGEAAFDEFSFGLIATDVIGKIPKVLKDHLKR